MIGRVPLDRVLRRDQLDALLPEHRLVGGLILTACIEQGFLDLVSELLIELPEVVALTTCLPHRVLVDARRALHHGQAVLLKELVVAVTEVVVHVRQREGLPRLVVVVEDEDVVVRMTANTIDMRH